jgi:hypothetical protein
MDNRTHHFLICPVCHGHSGDKASHIPCALELQTRLQTFVEDYQRNLQYISELKQANRKLTVELEFALEKWAEAANTIVSVARKYMGEELERRHKEALRELTQQTEALGFYTESDLRDLYAAADRTKNKDES